MQITVDRVGPYGVLVGDKWLGFEKTSGLRPEMFVKGVGYVVEVKEFKGKQYLKSAKAVESEVKPKSEDKPMTRTDLDSKDKRISRQGCIQAAVQALSRLVTKKEELFAEAEKLADQMLAYVNR